MKTELKIELDAPNVGELEKKYLDEAISKGFVSTFGPFISEFEGKIAEFLGVKEGAALQSGTAALYMALHELGVGSGDEVITPALTFAASVNPVLYTGATPVIVDVDPKTWNIDPQAIERAITEKTKAIIPVHVYGNPCDMGAIMELAKKHGLYIVEDTTESLGATYNGKNTGTFGDFGCLSFNGNKTITTGGGGMVVANDSKRIEHIRYLANQAKDSDNPGFHTELGFNYRMTNIEAALGLAQLERMDGFLKKQRSFRDIYKEELGSLSGVQFQETTPNASENGWFTCITIENKLNISDLIQKLKERGIPTRKVFTPLGKMPYLSKYAGSTPYASKIYESGLCLPSSTLNEQDDIKEAALIIREVLSE